jgi:nucleoside-diphosphate-sugar epimerase
MSSTERFLVTGALGCIGAWTCRALAREGTAVVAFDRDTDPRRLRDITTAEELARVTFEQGDITDLSSVERALDEHSITHVIHLAALQVPASRQNPPAGALVNVVGTVNVLEAAKRRMERIEQVVYTGSIGMYAMSDVDRSSGALLPEADPHPTNHYGVYKYANEGNARIYWQDNGLSSVGLRPMTVYGPGRDFGVTSGPTKAIAAAVIGRPYSISFGGATVFQFAADVAETLILAARSGLRGAHTYNLGGTLVAIKDFIAAIEAEVPEARGLISAAPAPLPFPEEISDRGLEAIGEAPITPLTAGISRTADFFRDQVRRGTFSAEKHGLEPIAATTAAANP